MTTAMRGGSTLYRLEGRFRRMAHVEFGPADGPAVICVHGLTRNGRDFDVLATALSDRFHVICPDLPGRGASDWLEDPALYHAGSYATALSHLLAAVGKPVSWVGTSLGGICGMVLAAEPGTPIGKLVLNDIGPRIPLVAVTRIARYMTALPPGEAKRFATLTELARHLSLVHEPFGPLSEAQWLTMAEHSSRPLPGGGLALHYDPDIAQPLRQGAAAADLSAFWARIRVPVLTVRGASSDLLEADVYEAMLKDGAEGYVVQDAGHAPALLDADSIRAVRRFLEGEGSALDPSRLSVPGTMGP